MVNMFKFLKSKYVKRSNIVDYILSRKSSAEDRIWYRDNLEKGDNPNALDDWDKALGQIAIEISTGRDLERE